MAPYETMPINQEENKQGLGQRIWDLLTKPASSITDRAEIRRARTLSAFLLVFISLTIIRVIVGLISGSYLEEPGPFINIIILVALLIISYGLSRTKNNSWASALAIISSILIVYLAIILRGDYAQARMFGTFMWFIPALILGSAFFSWRTTLLVSALALALILVTPFIIPEVEIGDVTTAFSLIFVVSLLLVVVNRFRDQLESDRQFELNIINEELAQSSVLLEQRVADRTRALEASMVVSHSLSTILDRQQLVSEVVVQVQSAFNYYHVHIYLVDPTTGNLMMTGGTGEAGKAMLAGGHKIKQGRGLVGRAAANNELILVQDVSQDEAWLPNPLLPDTKAETAVPITFGTDLLGVLDIQHNIANGLDEEDTNILQSIADQVAVALRNIRLFNQAQAQAEKQITLNEINQHIRATVNIDDVLRVAAREMGQSLNAKRVSVELNHTPTENSN